MKSHKTQISPPHHESGAMVVEFALVAPIFFLVLFATLELGIYLHDRQVLTNAAREAARYGIVMQSPRHDVTEIQQRALDFSGSVIGVSLNCTPGTDCPDIEVTTQTPAVPGSPLTVAISTPFPFPLLSAFGEGSFSSFLPVGGTSTMILE